MLDQRTHHYLEEVLSTYVGRKICINQVNRVHGGDINETYQLKTDSRSFFLKVNSSKRFPRMFEQEAIGLGALLGTNTIRIPKTIALDEFEDATFLVLEWIEQGSPSTNFWEDFGHQLAALHQTTNDQFGWTQDNFIGTLVQHNQWTNTWSEFFILQRLEPQLNIALQQGKMNLNHVRSFDKLFQKLDGLFPKESPALLHGDLWSGNYIIDEKGHPVIMDPAVYYGHREMDLAMTKLFGGFDSELYESYHEIFPLETNWEERVSLCNLYPLLVHVNLFGGGYVSQVESIIGRIV